MVTTNKISWNDNSSNHRVWYTNNSSSKEKVGITNYTTINFEKRLERSNSYL